MSLITLNSAGQDPFFYSCHFPQAINIRPYSQVCLLKFIHFRDSHVYNITTANNLLKFCIGNTTFDAIRDVRITPGQYSGDELATEIQTQMNDVLQQQHYEWSCVFTPEDDTTAPPTLENFNISYASLPTPAITALDGGDMIQLADNLALNTGQTALGILGEDGPDLAPSDPAYIPNFTMQVPKGIITHDGAFQVQDIPFSGENYDLQDPEKDENFAFDELFIGLVRNELSALSNLNPNLVFNPELQDVVINCNADGINISSINIAGNTKLGKPNYASPRPCRVIRPPHIKQLYTTLGKNEDDIPNFRFRFRYTALAPSRRIVIQLEVSTDSGASYTPCPDGSLGQDGKGDEFCNTFTASDGTTYQGTIWVSDKAEYNDQRANPAGGFISNRVQNLLITKKAPFKPTFTYGSKISRIAGPGYTDDGLVFENAAGDVATFEDYAGVHGYTYKLTIAGDANEYYLKENVNPGQNPYHYEMMVGDVAYAGNGQAEFSAQTDKLTITLNGGGAGPVVAVNVGASTAQLDNGVFNNTPMVYDAILNPNDRPLTLGNVNDGSSFNYEDDSAEIHGDNPDQTLALDGGEDLGADVSRQAMLFLRQLTVQDVANNSGAPANLRQGQTSGTIGTTIGSADNIIVATASTGKSIFLSNMATQKVSKDTVLNISIPELAGVKSFNGIDQAQGANLSGEAKNIAVLPREEFTQRGESAYGGLVYVSPFENWLDLNNGSEMNINQLTLEVRQPSGMLATDLRPDTIAQIKFRQDPAKLAKIEQDERFENLVLAISSATQTGQILSQTMYNKGS